MLTVAANSETKKETGAPINRAAFTSQQESQTRRNPDKRLENRERCLRRRGGIPTQGSHGGRPCFFLTHAPPDCNCATRFSWAASFPPHLNIYECCLASTFHYGGRLPGTGARNPFTPARACLGSLHFIQLQSVLHNAWPLRAELVLWRKMRGPKTARGPSEASSQVLDKINAEGGKNGVFQGYKLKLNELKSRRWKEAVPPPRETYESNFQARGE